MKRNMKKFIETWKTDFRFKTFVSSSASALFSLLYIVYNGFLGLYYSSVWNGTICIYYILLFAVRGLIIAYQKDLNNGKMSAKRVKLHNVYIGTHLIIFLLNLALIYPIIALVRGDRTSYFGLIPAIALAAYTTYKVVMAIINFKRSRKSDNGLVKELRTIGIIDTTVSVMTLQNTLIIASNGSISGNMVLLTICTNTGFWILIVVFSILSFKNSLIQENHS